MKTYPVNKSSSVCKSDPKDDPPSKYRLIKNLVIVSLSWWTLFFSYDELLMLQSTVNSQKSIGVISVSIQYGIGCLTAILLPKYLIQKLGHKTVICVSIGLHIPFIIANVYPHIVLMILTSFLSGFANPLAWAGLCSYLNNSSSLYASHSLKSSARNRMEQNEMELKNQSVTQYSEQCIPNGNSSYRHLESITARFFGFHGSIYHTCHIASNIVSFYILSHGASGDGYVKNSTCVCGIDFVQDQAACSDSNLKPPSDTTRYILMGVCVALGLVALVLVIFFVDDVVKKKKANANMSLGLMMATCKLMKRTEMMCLIPLSIHLGIIQGFTFGDFTQAYIGCAWGIPNVALVLSVFGLTLALSSTLSGWIVRYVGRLPIFLAAKVLTIALSYALYRVPPDGEHPAVMFAVSGAIGAVLGAYWSQLRAFLGVIFKEDEEAAFSNYQLWHGIGVCIYFALSKYFHTAVKVNLLIFFSTIGIVGYLIAERVHSRKRVRQQ